VPVLSRLFRGWVLQKLRAAHKANQLQFFGRQAHLAKPKSFAAYFAPLRKIEWYLYSKPPFGGAEAASKAEAHFVGNDKSRQVGQPLSRKAPNRIMLLSDWKASSHGPALGDADRPPGRRRSHLHNYSTHLGTRREWCQ
jgi:hypothetical protein